MTTFRIARLQKRGDILSARLDAVIEQLAQCEYGNYPYNLCALEHQLKAQLYKVNEKLLRLSERRGRQVEFYDFEWNDYTGVCVGGVI